MGDKHTPTRLYIGAQNDALFIIDRKPHYAPVDHVVLGDTAGVIAKMEGNDQAAEAEAARHA